MSADPITVVVTRRLRAGRDAAFAQWARELAEAAGAINGYRGMTVLAPDGGDDRHLVQRFADAASLSAWETSPARAALIARADVFSSAERQSLSGLETWFTLPGRRSIVPPPRWKMAAVTMLGAFPVAYLVGLLLTPHEHGLPLVVRSFVTVAILVPILTWVLMPRLTRLLRRWLYPAD